MQVVPGDNRWAGIGQGIGEGLQQGMTQGVDRARLQQGFNAAQSLLTPGPNGQQASPGQIYLQLAQQFAGIPGGLQHLSEVFPVLLQESQRQAGIRSLNASQGSQPSPMVNPNRLPDGEIRNVPNKGPKGQRTLNGVEQQGSPSNEQPYAMQTGGMGPGGGAEYPDQGSNRNINRAMGESKKAYQQEAQLGLEGADGETQDEFITPWGPEHPDYKRITPERVREVQQQQLMAGGNLDQAEKIISAERTAAHDENQAMQSFYENKRADQKAARQLSQEQNTFLDGELDGRGWKGDPFYEAMARREFLKNMGNPRLKTDTAKWDPVRRKMEDVVASKTALASSGVGRPYPGQNYEAGYDAAKRGVQDFLKTAGYKLPNGEIDRTITDEAITTLMKQGWSKNEATSMVFPISGGVKKVIQTAPPLPTPHGGVAVRGSTFEQEKGKRYDAMASRLLQTIRPYDSLGVIREQLNLEQGYEKDDFNQILNRMEAQGWERSDFQKRESPYLEENVYPSLMEMLHGRSALELYKKAGKLR